MTSSVVVAANADQLAHRGYVGQGPGRRLGIIVPVIRRLALLLCAVLAAVAVPFMTPAWACGCGAYDPGAGGHASVPTETALVRFGGGAEDVYLSLTVHSTATTGALMFPVPDKHATVKAAPVGLFDDLAELTDPPHDDSAGPGAANGGAQAPAPSVTVESRQQIGPLDVVTLTSGDAAALTQWLQHNGFAAKPALATAAKPYTDQGWTFVAVRLRPDAAGAILDGALDPLQIHFATSQPVYPMRLSAMAAEPETVHLFVLSAHRTELNTADQGLSASWANQLSGRELGPALTKVVAGGPTYLTRFDGQLDPHAITDDIHFRTAPSDQAVGAAPETATDTSGHVKTSSNVGVLVGIAVAIVVVGLVVWLAVRRRPRGVAR